MKLFKNYKKLYEIEKNNNKILTERNLELHKSYVAYQKEMKKYELKQEETIARLKIELEDTKGYLAQEKQAKEELLRQRNKANARKRVAKKKEESK